MSDVPADRCGFEMLAANLSPSTVASYNSLSEAVESERVAVCCRATVDDCDRCRWHTDSIVTSDTEGLDASPEKLTVLDGAHLSETTFETAQSFPYILLRYADFSRSEIFDADFSNSELAGANFSQSKVPGIDFSGASLPNADLSEADLLDGDLSNAGLQSADLSGARLLDSELSGAYMLGADLSNADLSDADLFDTRLVDADFSGSHLSGADLSDAWLTNADLSNADIVGADLSAADLRSANLHKTNVRDANATEANFHLADLSGADLRNIDMICTQLQEANLRAANLERADLSKADVFGADLTESKLYEAILSNLRINSKTRFGNHYTDKKHNIEKAAWTLRQIEQISRESALPEQVTEAVVERKTRRRRHHWKKQNPLEWFRNASFGLLTKYGESPGRVVGLSIGTILASAGLFQHTGIRDTTNGGEVISFALQNTTAANLVGKSLYLSTVTFTTVGYGDLQPVGFGQLVATVESFLGALLMALLVFVLGRRATR